MKQLVIIPAFNEEDSIQEVIRSVKRCHPAMDIVVVNDGSTDRTAEMARSAGDVHVIDLPINLGIGGAVQTGYLYAHRHGYELAVQLDGDGQHDPQELAKIVAPVAEGAADCCIGSRFLEKGGFRSSRSRRLGIVFFSWMIRWIAGVKFTDPTSGFRAVNRRVLDKFAQYYPDDYPEVEAIALLVRSGFTVRETPVRMRLRTGGSSSITPLKSLYYMLKVSLAVVMTRVRDTERASS